MNVLRITTLFLFISLSAAAKDSTNVEFKRFAFGIHASPDYCYRNISSTIYTTRYRDELEVPMWSYTAGVDLSCFLKKQFALSLGVTFSQKGFTTKKLETTTVAAPEGGIGKSKLRYNYNYIAIPVKAHVVLGKKRIRFLSSVGVTPAFMLYEQTICKIKYNNGSKDKVKGKPNYIYNPFNLFLSGSIGIDCNLGKRMGLRIEPTYSYGLFETLNGPVSEHLWNAGLDVGCYFRL